MNFIGGGGGGGGGRGAAPAGGRGAAPAGGRGDRRPVPTRRRCARRSGGRRWWRSRTGGGPAVVGPGASRGPWGMGPQGLPLIKPPYGRITAYNMNTGDIVWQVANGDTYEWIKTHPALKGLTIPKTGRADEGGIVVTKTLAFAGQGCGLFRGGGGGGPMFYAYDKATGAVVHETATAGQHVWQSDDLHGQRQAIHRRRSRRAELPRRAGRAVASLAGSLLAGSW